MPGSATATSSANAASRNARLSGRVTNTAKALKLSRATLYRRIKLLKIDLDG